MIESDGTFPTPEAALMDILRRLEPGTSIDINIHQPGCEAGDDADEDCPCGPSVLHHGHEAAECEVQAS